jgi:hypothetical protein
MNKAAYTSEMRELNKPLRKFQNLDNNLLILQECTVLIIQNRGTKNKIKLI